MRPRAPGPRPGLRPGDRPAESKRRRRWSRRACCPGSSCRDGVPPHLRTLVVVPTLLTDRAEVEEQIERLEVHYLANPDGDVRFAVLSDWTDAPAASAPGDDETLAAAREGIARLNRRHGADGGRRRAIPALPPPAALERERAARGWDGSASAGKLHELNRLLRGATDTSFLPTGLRGAVRCPLRHHARRRHPAAARRGRAAGRHDGASAQPAAIRSRTRTASSRDTPCSSRG